MVVGLGNPGPTYRDTRHNIGHRVVEQLAATLGASWQREGRALLARAAWRDAPVVLAVLLGFMNESGPVLAGALERLGAGSGDVILVHDDIDLPLGVVRVRMRGGHGGHNGVRSVLETLQTEEIRRVKLGVGRPDSREQVVDHVLTAFTPDEEPAVRAAVTEAAERVLALVHTPSRS